MPRLKCLFFLACHHLPHHIASMILQRQDLALVVHGSRVVPASVSPEIIDKLGFLLHIREAFAFSGCISPDLIISGSQY